MAVISDQVAGLGVRLSDLRAKKQEAARLAAEEWEERNGDLEREILSVVREMKDRGAPIAYIARAYGTEDRGTIYNIIRRVPGVPVTAREERDA